MQELHSFLALYGGEIEIWLLQVGFPSASKTVIILPYF